ncbi:MAG: fatty acyl-AMP ligase [Acidobacteria bacterium]|nr:fatty acyl-AMP ligase [Acidobacteriota bacterium]
MENQLSEPVADSLTVIDILRRRAIHEASRRAYTFLRDGMTEGESLSYGELDQQARAIAAMLQSIVPKGERILLLHPPGLDFISAFFGCLYAGLVAIPAYSPRPNRSFSRIEAIARDAQPSVALTTSDLLPKIQAQLSPQLESLSHWFATDCVAPSLEERWKDPGIGADSLAYLQYTSGSTATPKGVMVGHGNLMRNLRDLDEGWQHTSDSVIVSWLPTFHDMGLVYGILEPVYRGFPCILMPPASFLQRPIRWLRAISDYKGTHSAAPNFAYELCVRKIKSDECANLDLSSWVAAVNGAEPVRKETLGRFTQAFQPYGFQGSAFCPGYGLAEATLKVSAVRSMETPRFCFVEKAALEKGQVRFGVGENGDARQRQRTLVGCGRPALGTKVAIVNPASLTHCQPDEVGEIWVSGPSVTQGYWNRSEVNASVFGAYLGDDGTRSVQGPFLRTGDLGFLNDGELFITGRLKDLIIIRGQNHYPEDIERTVEQSHPALRPGCCAAFSVDIDNEERLIVMQEVERTYRNPDPEELVGVIRQAVAEIHDLQAYKVVLLNPGGILKTSSGKIQRQACRANYLTGTVDLWEKTAGILRLAGRGLADE